MNETLDPLPSISPIPAARTLSWGAVIAGAVGALAIQVVLMMLAAGLGFAAFNPSTDDDPVAHFGIAAALLQGITAVVSLWAGGWIAGRCLGWGGRAAGGLHGFLVWCLGTAVTLLIILLGSGWALGGLTKLVGNGLSMAGKPAAAAVSSMGEMAKDAAEQYKGLVGSFIDEGSATLGEGRSPAEASRIKRNLGLAIRRLVSSEESDVQTNQQKVVDVLVQQAGMTETDARRTVTEWNDTYTSLKEDLNAAKERAEDKAREAAETASKALSILSLASFVAFLLGATAAIVGGNHGGRRAFDRADELIITRGTMG